MENRVKFIKCKDGVYRHPDYKEFAKRRLAAENAGENDSNVDWLAIPDVVETPAATKTARHSNGR